MTFSAEFQTLIRVIFKLRLTLHFTQAYDPVENEFDSDLPDADIPDIDLPAKYDWREQGAVTPVKNQGTVYFRIFDPSLLQVKVFSRLFDSVFKII